MEQALPVTEQKEEEMKAMSDQKAIVPVEQKQVDFYGDSLIAVRVSDGGVYVPVRPICELLGIDWNCQRRHINRDPVLTEEMRGVDVTSTPGGRQTMLCL